ncbi:unnamed protein product [Mytilus edulis]|nr:unnamed protein product [Mytilus edulis]
MIRRNIHETLIKQKPAVEHLGIKQNYDDSLRQKIQADLNDTANYKDHLNEISKQVMLSGIGTTNKFIEYLISFWSTFPLDSVKMKQYSVLLSYRNYTSKSSSISVLSTIPNTSVVFQAHYNHDNMSGIHPDYIPFNAYSPSGFVRVSVDHMTDMWIHPDYIPFNAYSPSGFVRVSVDHMTDMWIHPDYIPFNAYSPSGFVRVSVDHMTDMWIHPDYIPFNAYSPSGFVRVSVDHMTDMWIHPDYIPFNAYSPSGFVRVSVGHMTDMWIHPDYKPFNAYSPSGFVRVSVDHMTDMCIHPDYIPFNAYSPSGFVRVSVDHMTDMWIHPDYIPFNAYSPSGFVRVSFNTWQEANSSMQIMDAKRFSRLKKLNVTIKKNVVLVKYGKIHPANKVLHAQTEGAAGVILYPDPADYANGQSIVYPKTWWLPGWAVPLSHVRYNLVGDPQTPGYPAINGAPHTLAENADYPKIPVQPIGYDDARYLMSQLGGQTAPDEWRGCLNVSYKTGPGFSDESLQLELDVNNVIERRNISNVIAVIDGKYEKDKFVIIGAHTDSWTKGGVDHATGYSVIWELARGFSALVRDGWRPRRTIMLALWDASKYGHIGSFEWVQEYEKMLGRGAVAYINLDSVIRGNYSFHAEANPLLYSIIKNSTQKVPCTDPDYYDKSVYDMWLERFMDPGKPSQPKINPLNGDSDHTPFEYYLGVPSVSPMYTFNSKIYPHLPTYPAFSTLEDDKEYVETFLDKDTKLEQTVTKIVADMVLLLADSAVLPFDVQNYAQVFDRGKKYLRENEAVISSANVDINVLYSKIDLFIEATKTFAFNVTSINLDSLKESDLYLINDKLLELPRIFINYQGIPGYPQYRHLLLAPHAENLWDDQIFPGIAVTIEQCQTNKECDPLRQQIALLIVSVHQAVEIIQDEIFIRYS